MTQTSKSLLALLVTCLMLNCPVLFAQIKANYHFGFIGTTGDTSVKNSESVMIEYSKCFDVSNGLSKFSSPKFGAFAISCAEVAPKLELMVTAYPNPVVNVLTIRSLTDYPDRGVSRYSLLFTDLSGKPIKEVRTDLQSIIKGFSMRVSDLPMGYYIVTLYADKERVQSFKILKAA